MKATDLKCNQRVKTMEPSEDDLKMKKESLKVELLKTYGKYIEEKCDKDGCIIENNLTSGLEKGIRKLKNRIEGGDVVIFRILSKVVLAVA